MHSTKLLAFTSFDKKMHKVQAAMQKHAQALAEHNNKPLGYELNSLNQVDDLLSAIASELRAAGLNTEDQIASHNGSKGIVEALGCYVSECAERKSGKGTWSAKDPNTGRPALSLRLESGAVIFPMDWVIKKLVDPNHYKVDTAYREYVLQQE